MGNLSSRGARAWRLWPWLMVATGVLWLLVRPRLQPSPGPALIAANTDPRGVSLGAFTCPDPGEVLQLAEQLKPTAKEPANTDAGRSPKGSIGAGHEESDEDWLSLPRTRGLLDQMIGDLGAGATDHSRRMFRNVHLNPHDRRIPRGVREELDTVIATLAPSLGRCYQAWINVYAQDLEQAIATGTATIADPALATREVARPTGGTKKMVNLTSPSSNDSWDMFSFRDGVLYQAKRKDSPRSRSTLEVQRYTELHLSLSIIQWFERAGCLDRSEASALEERAVRASER